MITLLFTDKSFTPIGQPVARFTSVVVTLKFNQPASVLVTVPALAQYLEVAQPGNRLMVIRDGQVLVEPIEFPGALSWSAGSGSDNSEPGQLLIASTSDSMWLERRLVYPDPAHASTAQTADFYTLTGSNAEVAMRDLVTRNASTSAAVTARRVPGLILGSLAGVGTNINVRARFSVLADELRSAALAGGGLGFDVRRDGTDLKFVVFDPADLSASVFFGRSFGNLRNVDYTPQAPTADVAIVGGDGTGATRTIVERSDSTAVSTWGRREVFVGNSSSSTTDLNQAGDEALTQAGEQGTLALQAIDTDLVRFGVDYNLGDLVSAEIYPGVVIADVVRQVVLTATKDGEVVAPQIGTASSSSDPKYVRKLRAIERRLGQLERT